MAMMISKLKIALIFPIVLGIGCLTANAQTTDYRARAGVKVQKDISKALTASLEYEHRFDNYLTAFDKALIEPSVSLDLFKFLRIGAEWRFMVDQNLVREIEYKQRAAFYIRGQHSIDDFDFKLRTAIQYGFDELTVSSGLGQKLISRNTVEVEYNWFGSKFKPSVRPHQ